MATPLKASDHFGGKERRRAIALRSAMKSYSEILAQEDDGADALDLFDRGFPNSVYRYNEDQPNNPGLGMMFLNLKRLEDAIVMNGFCSIFDQHIVPWELKAHEHFLEEIGAIAFLEHFRKCRILYFGSERLPQSYEEWEALEPAPAISDPDSPEATRFDEEAELAEAAFYRVGIAPGEYIDLHVRLGRYMRIVLPKILKPEELQT